MIDTDLNEEKLSAMKKFELKSYLKSLIYKAAFTQLKKGQDKHTEVNNIKYESLKKLS